MKKRYFSLILALTMVFSFTPVNMLADEEIEQITPVSNEVQAEGDLSSEMQDPDEEIGSNPQSVEGAIDSKQPEEDLSDAMQTTEEETSDNQLQEAQAAINDGGTEDIDETTKEQNSFENPVGDGFLYEQSEDNQAVVDGSDSEHSEAEEVPIEQSESENPVGEGSLNEQAPADESNLEQLDTPVFELDEDGETLVKYNGEEEVVTIPDGIKEIGERAFENNTKIKKIILPDSVEFIREYAFANCSNLEGVVIGNESKLTTIEDYAFKNDVLLDISFAEGVVNKKENIFDGIINILTEENDNENNVLAETAGLDQLEDDSSDDEYMLDQIMNEDLPAEEEAEVVYDASIFELNEAGDILLQYKGSAEIVEVPEGVTEIGERAFENNEIIKRVLFSNSVVIINKYAFANCPNLEEVVLYDGNMLSIIGNYAFMNDTKLDTSFADGISNILDNAFEGVGKEDEELDQAKIRLFLSNPNEMVINTQPVNAEGVIGDTVSYTVDASNVASYQWQAYVRGKWTNSSASGNNTATVTYEVKAANIAFKWRCVLTDAEGNELYTDVVQVVEPAAPAEEMVINTQPVNAEGVIGDTVSYTVDASNVASYQWQAYVRGKWTNSSASGNNTATVTYEVKAANIAFKWRCVLTDAEGNELYTDVVQVVEPAAPAEEMVINTQPVNAEGVIGDTVSYTVDASNVASYQWQAYVKGKWTNSSASGNNTATVTYEVKAANIAFKWRCVLTDAEGNELYTDVVQVVEPAAPAEEMVINTQPVNAEGVIGDTVSYTVDASNVASYQWQAYVKGKWTNSSASGNNTATVTYEVKAANIAFKWRCVLTDAEGNELYTDVVQVVEPAAPAEEMVINTQPVNAEGVIGDTVSYTVDASNVASYQWQAYVRGKWTNSSASGNNTATVTYEVKAANIAFKWRCVLTDAEGNELYTDVVQVVEPAAPAEEMVINTQPVNAEGVIGDTVSYTVDASNVASYQWQAYVRGKWTNSSASGNNTATVTYEVKAANIAFKWRCVLTDAEGNELYSDVVQVVEPIISDTFTVDGVTYHILDEQDSGGIHVEVTGYEGSASILTIPTHPVNPDNQTETYKVTEIGVEAFQNKSTITKITLPNSVTIIRARAFQGCTSLSEMDTCD